MLLRFRFRSVRDFGIHPPVNVAYTRFNPYGRFARQYRAGARQATVHPHPHDRHPRVVRPQPRRPPIAKHAMKKATKKGGGGKPVKQYGDDNPALGPHVPKRMDGLPVVTHVEQSTPIRRKPIRLGQVNPKWRQAKSGGSVVFKGSKLIIHPQHAHVYTTVRRGRPYSYIRVIPARQVVVDRSSKTISITLDPEKLKALAKKLGIKGKMAITVNVNNNRAVMVAYYDPSTGKITVPNGQGYVKGDTIVFNVGKYLGNRQIVRFTASVYGRYGGVEQEIVGIAGYDFRGQGR